MAPSTRAICSPGTKRPPTVPPIRTIRSAFSFAKRNTRMKRPPSPPPATQRRQHARLGLRMSAEIRTERSVFTATTRDLSEGGAGLDSERPLEEGEEIALGLFLVLDDV